MAKDSFVSELIDELTGRGYENLTDCSIIGPPIIAYTDSTGCQYSIIYGDDGAIKIICNHICEVDETDFTRCLLLCNSLNTDARFARFYCNESGGIIASSEVLCSNENLIQVCADTFDIFVEQVDGLVSFLGDN